MFECNNEFLTEEEVAGWLKISQRTLQAWRQRGGGPPFIKIGRLVRYRASDMVSWLSGQARAQGQPHHDWVEVRT